jgi:excisionase family DNA binding protein
VEAIPADPPVLDAEAVAELLGLSVLAVRRLTDEGRIPARQVPGGRRVFDLRSEVAGWRPDR